jgi:hypothetical protein
MHPVQTHARLAELHPLGRMGEIAVVADAILYLESAGFVTAKPFTSMAAIARATLRRAGKDVRCVDQLMLAATASAVTIARLTCSPGGSQTLR